MIGERFEGFTTDGEERWLSGDGPQPPSAGQHLPPRAGLLMPHAGAGGTQIEDERTVRLWVGQSGELQLRDRTGTVRTLAGKGAVQGCWWVVGAAQAAVGLAALKGGWLVLVGRTGPVLALRMSDWAPPQLEPAAAETLRAAGVQGLADALGVDLEAVADPAEAGQRIGQVAAATRFVLDPPLRRGYAGSVLGTPLLILAAYCVALATAPTAVATAVAVALLLLMPIYDVVLLPRRYRRTAALPSLASVWWPAQPLDGPRTGAGIGLVDGVAGQELVLADGFGWEGWFPGPGLGGAASLVVVTAGGRSWGLVLHDRDQRILQVLAVRDWAATDEAVESLAGAGLGLPVSTAAREETAQLSGRALARRSAGHDIATSMGATVYTAIVCILFSTAAMVADLNAEQAVFLGTGAALLVLRFGLRWRRVA